MIHVIYLNMATTSPKSKRMQAVRSVLERWGRLRKPQIDQSVAAILGEVVDSAFSRAIYRDLEQLVADGTVRDFRFGQDGSVIEEYDPEVHRNSIAEWALVDSTSQVSGDLYLQQCGVHFYSTTRIRSAVCFDLGKNCLKPSGSHIELCFLIGQQFLVLKIDKDKIPIRIIVGRPLADETYQVPLEELEKKYGLRSAILLLPIPTLSSVISAEKSGHFLIEIIDGSKFKITDLYSRNGTGVSGISKTAAEAIISEWSSFGGTTVTKSVQNSSTLEPTPQPLNPNESVEFTESCILVQAGKSFQLLGRAA